MCHLTAEFYENRLSSFRVTLLTNKQINADENKTSLAEVTRQNGYRQWLAGEPVMLLVRR